MRLVIADDEDEQFEESLQDSDILGMLTDHFGSPHNLLQICGGSGTYLLLGPTESGKTESLGALYREAQEYSREGVIDIPPVVASSFVIMSDTDEMTEQLSWCASRSTRFDVNDRNLEMIIEERKKEIQKGAEDYNKANPDAPQVTGKEWGNDHPQFIIVDDFYGKMDASRPHNIINQLTTKARNFGVYLFLLAQGFNQCSPLIKKNARAIIAFRLEAQDHYEILKNRYGRVKKEIEAACTNHNLKKWRPVVYIRTWELSDDKFGNITPYPLLLPPFVPLGEMSVRTNNNNGDIELDYGEEEDSDDEQFIDDDTFESTMRSPPMKRVKSEWSVDM